MDKDHGRIENRGLWSVATDPKAMGLAGVAQVVRIHCHVQIIRKGKVIKETDENRFAVTSYFPEEADPDALLQLARDHWSIENRQHYRRDRTQNEDRYLRAHGACSCVRQAAFFSGLHFQGRNSSRFSGALPPWRAQASKYARK